MGTYNPGLVVAKLLTPDCISHEACYRGNRLVLYTRVPIRDQEQRTVGRRASSSIPIKYLLPEQPPQFACRLVRKTQLARQPEQHAAQVLIDDSGVMDRILIHPNGRDLQREIRSPAGAEPPWPIGETIPLTYRPVPDIAWTDACKLHSARQRKMHTQHTPFATV